MRIPAAVAAILLGPSPASAADSWGLDNEQVVELRGEVVDLLCLLKGDCPPACGGGQRQLGLVTTDGRLLPLVKGGTNFANGITDLLPHCGSEIEVDGLLIAHPALPMLFVQNLRTAPDQPWQPATAFEREWRARHGEAEEWYREDPAVKAVIEADGVLGIPGAEPEP